MFMRQNSVNFCKCLKIHQSILAHSQSSLRRNAVPWKNYKHFLPSYFIQQTPIKWITYTLAGGNRPILRVLLVKHLKLAVQMLIQLQNRRQIPWPIAVIRRRPHLHSHALLSHTVHTACWKKYWYPSIAIWCARHTRSNPFTLLNSSATSSPNTQPAPRKFLRKLRHRFKNGGYPSMSCSGSDQTRSA